MAKALAPVSKAYAGMPGIVSLLLTYLFLLAVTTIGTAIMGGNVRRFAVGFTIIFWIAYVCWIIGHYAYIAATPDKMANSE